MVVAVKKILAAFRLKGCKVCGGDLFLEIYFIKGIRHKQYKCLHCSRTEDVEFPGSKPFSHKVYAVR